MRVPECVCSDPPPYKLLRSFTQILIVTEWVYMVAVPVKEQERSTDTIRHAFKLGSQKQVPADRLKLRLYIHIPDRAQCLWSPHASVICIIRALLIEALVGIASAAVAAGSFCWMVKYTVLKEADMIVIAAFLWLWVACKLLTWANRRNTHVA